MASTKSLVVVIGVILLVAATNLSSASDSENSNNKKDADNLFPLLFLLSGGVSTMSGATVWMVGVFSLGVVALLGYQRQGFKVKEM